MLAYGPHAGRMQAPYKGRTERADRFGRGMERAIANYRAGAVVEVENRRETEIDAMRRELGADCMTSTLGCSHRRRAITIPEFAKTPHGRNGRESVPEPLDPAAFMVDANEQFGRAQGADFGRE